ncbi:MAG: zinc carboxypeptidase, partial [Psychroserpens sp.]|nr:zinc carboxypeptidase [Psychroserpens sp.]
MKRSLSVVVIFLLTLQLYGQNFQSPSEFLGYEIGTKFSRHHQVIDYFQHVAEQNTSRVQLMEYGKTNEGRRLMLGFISSEANMNNLETIRQNNLKNTGILDGSATNNDIAIVWLSYNVHGNEASSTEASMNTIYKLLTENSSYLENTVVIIDPCVNP